MQCRPLLRGLRWFAVAAAVLGIFFAVVLRLASVGSPAEQALAAKQNVTAYRLVSAHDALIETFHRHALGDEAVTLGDAVMQSQMFRVLVQRLDGPFLAPFVAEQGLASQVREMRHLVLLTDAWTRGAFPTSTARLARAATAVEPAVERVAQALSNRNALHRQSMLADLDRYSNLLLLCVLAFIVFTGGLLVKLLQRNAALSEQTRALEDSEVALRELSYFRQQFLANMSHEFRTPLNAIQGFSQAILYHGQRMSREQLIEYVTLVERSARDLTHLTNDVLDLSKIDAGTMELVKRDVPFTDLIEDVVVQQNAAAGPRAIEVTSRIEQDWLVRCDRDGIKRSISNVVGNAVKFSDEGSKVGIHAYRRECGVLVVEVSDRGCGIPSAELSHVWQGYARSSLTRDSDRSGAGLGLAIVKSLVSAHNGFVEVESEVGRGTIMRLCFPASAVIETLPRNARVIPLERASA